MRGAADAFFDQLSHVVAIAPPACGHSPSLSPNHVRETARIPLSVDHEDRPQRHGRRRDERDGFVCRHCRRPVSAESYGTKHRNHCPQCLWSVHLDNSPGDRMSACTGAMEPIAVWVRPDGEWAIVHRCQSCGVLRTNRVAGDDSPWAMLSLAARPLAQPPFPLDV